jgi:nitroimidazol reductase NimA-like FMN-containing flavoprotein (pyridoxamine 5'-phosphate oxidase superfamily)
MRESLIRSNSAWSAAEIESFLLRNEIPVRLACLSGSGAPLLCSVWYLYDDGGIWCATQRGALLVKRLENDPRCAFEIAGDLPPYCGVRGQGRAVLSPADGPAVLLRLIDRYLHGRDSEFARWLMARQDAEVAIRIEPDWLTSWDFSARMKR